MKISHLIKDKTLLKKLFPFNVTDYISINPSNNVLEERFGFHSSQEIKKRIKNSYQSFLNWKETPLENRLEKMNNLTVILENNKEVLAKVITKEMVLISVIFRENQLLIQRLKSTNVLSTLNSTKTKIILNLTLKIVK